MPNDGTWSSGKTSLRRNGFRLLWQSGEISRRLKSIKIKPGRVKVDTVHDFEDMLHLLNQHEVKYLIIGGLAFLYHATGPWKISAVLYPLSRTISTKSSRSEQ